MVQKWFSNGSSRYPRVNKEPVIVLPKEEGNWKSKYTYGKTDVNNPF